MGAFTAYAISVAIILAIEYLAYKSLLANATFYRFNRFIILGCYAMSLLVIPLARFMNSGHGSMSPAGIEIGTPLLTAGQIPGDDISGTADIWKLVPCVYILGVAAMMCMTVLSYAKMMLIIRRGEKRRFGNAVIVVSRTKISPFSWGKYLVVSPEDADNRLILDHESCHIRNLHSLDLIFTQFFTIFNWFNPAAYLLRAELSAVHEYEVDAQIMQSGADVTEYQMLLIRKAVGPGFQSIANSLNHSQLKNRLTMMSKSRTKSARRLCAGLLLPAALLAAAMTDFPAVASTIANVAAVSYDKGSEKSENVQASRPATQQPQATPATSGEAMPQYPGGEQAMMRAMNEELKFPEGKIAEGAKGLVVVGFTVTAEGKMTDFTIRSSSNDEALDAEAIRATKAALTQTWTPGTIDGKPVSVQYALPVRFALK